MGGVRVVGLSTGKIPIVVGSNQLADRSQEDQLSRIGRGFPAYADPRVLEIIAEEREFQQPRANRNSAEIRRRSGGVSHRLSHGGPGVRKPEFRGIPLAATHSFLHSSAEGMLRMGSAGFGRDAPGEKGFDDFDYEFRRP